ncbi:cation:proton antiporter [Streptomyces salyersiae]|uniref:Cation:proton antiporter n=1 Tax=Streptomyces salyersiae TaxID=3075530 RepID=A0ABU2RVU4_9ACTN|nr:cation:proton antiporter [Streptomyces sp. DSM 41770]MDT0432942.1 cation:proton antiporter [Streptomyces sp. DSM 41770]
MVIAAAASNPLSQLLIVVPVVILASGLGAWAVRRFGQPAVVGEIAVGICLGPSLLGLVWPGLQHRLFPADILPFIGALGDLGLLAFMFLVGLALNLGLLRGHSRTAVAVSQMSIALPLVLGSALALGMYGTFAPDGVDKLPFVLFIAVSMSITAFPVLARILTERDLYRTRTGAVAMACAAVDDVTAWCLLAVVVAVTSSSSPMAALVTVGLSVLYMLVMLYVVRPLLARWVARAERKWSDSAVLVVLFTGLCLSALATEEIGVHALFGAFVFGTMVPRDSPAVERAAARLQAVAVPILLPLFFVSTGLKTDLALLVRSGEQWLWVLAVMAVAVTGKWGGGSVAARLSGQRWRESLAIGALMNCRGLTELVVLNIGLSLGVIGTDLFAILVVMALVTTAMTSPLLTRILGPQPRPESDAPPASGAEALSGPDGAVRTARSKEPAETA